MGAPLLLVEDTPSLSLVYKAVLNRVGYDVDCAPTCADSKAKLAHTEYKVILLDLLLPDGDGGQLMAEVLASAIRARCSRMA